VNQRDPDQTTPRIRVANFTDIALPAAEVLPLDLVSGADPVAVIRRHADLPYVFLIAGDKSARIPPILSRLREIRSSCFPRAVFIVGSVGGMPVDPDVEVFELESSQADDIVAAISEYCRSTLVYDKAKLLLGNPAPLPERVDVLIVGAGVTGLYAANKFREKSLSYAVVEKRDDVGGIWSQYANTTSQVNTSEGAYRICEPSVRANRDHSPTAEILQDIESSATRVTEQLFTGATVEKIERQEGGYLTKVNRNGSVQMVESTGVILAINDRVGAPREITFDGEDAFQGSIVKGISDEAARVDWKGKRVVVVGMGAFAVENVRTALQAGASHVTVVCRRHGTVCPKIIDYLNFATPYNDRFEHDRKSNIRNMMLWKKLYDLSGATEPECWMGKIKHEGHTISVSDIWFVAHHLKKMATVTGSITRMFEHGVVVNDQQRIEADVVVKCVGFHRNASAAQALTGYTETYNTNYVDKDFMYLADAYLDDDVFNSFFGSSVVEMTKFYLDVFLEFLDRTEYEQMDKVAGIEKIPITQRSWSHYIAGAEALLGHYPSLYEAATDQVEKRTADFLEAHDLETFIAENRREWFATHRLLAGEGLAEKDCLPYVFDKLIGK
jgi:hypothetical protein